MSAAPGSGNTGGQASAHGLLHSVRSIGPALLAMVRTRLELFGVELAEERERTLGLAVTLALGVVFGGLALLLVNVLVLAWFWDSHRYIAICGLLVVYGAAAGACVWRLQAAMASRAPMFEATLAEIKADIEALGRVRQD